MTTSKSVLGVSGVCWVDFRYPTQIEALFFGGLRALCRVCWVSLRGRACVTLDVRFLMANYFLHARTEVLNKPNTLNTTRLKLLILKGFVCVGFVSGLVFFVSGSVFGGVGR
ncbi:hypothetical protein D3C84_907890 [compost metagenome]